MTQVERLRNSLLKLVGESYEKCNQKAKIDEVQKMNFLHDDRYYKQKIYCCIDDDAIEKLRPVIEFCETREQHDLWTYFRVYTSSIRTYKNIGRNMRMLLKDEVTGKYIGIFSLGSDLRQYSARDKYIGWNPMHDLTKLKYIMNINCCVGLQPVAYNFNIGKLMVALCYSKEVHDKFREKYDHDIACITTFAINGKSIQYDRMKQYLKYVGETKGFGTISVPDKLYDKCMDFLKNIKDNRSQGLSRMHKLRKVLQYLDIDPDLVLKHGQQRGVYIGFTSKDSIKFLRGEVESFDPKLEDANRIIDWWKKRWASPRFQHLKTTGRLDSKIRLIDPRRIYLIQRVQKSIEKKKKQIGEDVFNEEKRLYMQEYRHNKNFAIIDVDVNKIPDIELSYSYIAGLSDGDGSLQLNGVINPIVSFEINQCSPIVLYQLQKRFGGRIGKKMMPGNKRDQYNYSLNGLNSLDFIRSVAPYAIIDSKKYDLALKFLTKNKENNTKELSRRELGLIIVRGPNVSI